MGFKQSANVCLLWIAIVIHAQEYPNPSQQYNGTPQNQHYNSPSQQQYNSPNLQQYNDPPQQQNSVLAPQQQYSGQEQQNPFFQQEPQVYQAPVENSQYQQQYGSYNQATEPGMPYNFAWSVQDNSYGNNDYGHQEQSDGRVVTGSYRIALPDGRTQIVTYRVEGDSGFVAEVRYEGQAQHPQPSSNQYGQQQLQQYSNNQGNNDPQAYQPPQQQQHVYPQQY